MLISLFSSNSTETDALMSQINCSDVLKPNYEPFHPDPDTDEKLRLDCMFKAIMPRWLHELQSCTEEFPKNGRIVYSAVGKSSFSSFLCLASFSTTKVSYLAGIESTRILQMLQCLHWKKGLKIFNRMRNGEPAFSFSHSRIFFRLNNL